ncbi:unnamed protein product [Notodromas monacha]|uniref:Transporter n=1 Tax=Notodromas monacha TaxID=399045 RepID=A0A7R9BQZ3_9CRUS|nr:unnamed protein product [Notodromas monacha]CAG0918709.1 unnamed protein product [Notodromas monacha]
MANEEQSVPTDIEKTSEIVLTDRGSIVGPPQTLEVKPLQRQKWGSKVEFLMSSISYAVGFGNIWRFPYLVYRYGGGTFLVPYTFFVVTVAMPLMLLESSAAQYAGLGPFHLYTAMCPAFRGLGYMSIYISYVNTAQYALILSYVVRYTIDSFNMDLPWSVCYPDSGPGCVGKCSEKLDGQNYVIFDKQCHLASESCTQKMGGELGCADGNGTSLTIQDPAFSYFYDKVADIRLDNEKIASWDDYGHFVPEGMGCLMLSYIMCLLCLRQGVSTSGKVVYFTALFPYVVLTLLLIKAATLQGFTEGVKFYLKPDLSALIDFEVWYQALSQIFFSLGIGFGGLMTLSSYNTFDTPCIKLAAAVTIANCATSIYAGFVIFGSLGYIAQTTGQAIDKVAGSGINLTFVTFATTLTLLPAAPFWSFMFFFMLITVGLGTQMADLSTQITALLDQFPWSRRRKMLTTTVVCTLGFCGACTMSFQGGIWLNVLLNDYAATAPILLLTLGNLAALVGFYGFPNLMNNIEEMVGKLNKVGYWYLRITWSLLAPIFVLVLVIYFFVSFPGSQYEKPAEPGFFPSWVQGIGIVMCIIPVILFLIGVTLTYFVAGGRDDDDDDVDICTGSPLEGGAGAPGPSSPDKGLAGRH